MNYKETLRACVPFMGGLLLTLVATMPTKAMAKANLRQAMAMDKTQPVAENKSSLSAVELVATGVIIYPQRLPLHGEETLMDVLQLYPNLLQAGFDNVLSQFSLKVERKLVLGNVRNALSQVLAKDVERINIVDNPGVSGGGGGMGGAIIVDFVKREGLHGTVGIEAANSGPGSPYTTKYHANVLPSAMVNYVKGTTELTSAVDYGHGTVDGLTKDVESALLDYKLKPSSRDNTTLLFSQKFSHSRDDASSSFERTIQTSATNVHQFNDKGLALVTQLYFMNANSPVYATVFDTPLSFRTHTYIPVGVAEMQIPLSVKGMNLSVGYQFEFVRLRYDFDVDGILPSDDSRLPLEGCFDAASHHVMGNLSYVLPKWRLNVGCRTIMTSYRSDTHTEKVKKRFVNRWLWNASAVYVPNQRQQVQLEYSHKYFNPTYANFDLREMLEYGPEIENINLDDDKFRNTLIEQVKLVYRGQWNQFALHANAGYVHLDGFVKLAGMKTDWVVNNTWMAEATGAWNSKLLGIVAGASYYTNEYRTDDVSNNIHSPFALFKIVPTLYLPFRWQVRAQTIFFTQNAPLRQLTDNAVYASLKVNKQIGKLFDVYMQWHDIFYGSHSFIVGGVNVRF